MAQTNILILIPTTTYSGSLSANPISLIGNSVFTASYYVARKSLQTVSWSFTNDFNATVTIQATLVEQPTESDWFNLHTINHTSDKTGFSNLEGLFVKLRASVTNWTSGTIHNITLSY